MGAAVARAEARPPEPDEVERTTVEDWKATAVRLKKRWEYGTRSPGGGPGSGGETEGGLWTSRERRDVEMVAKAAVEVFAQHTLDGPREATGGATVMTGPGTSATAAP